MQRMSKFEQQFASDSKVFHWDLYCGWIECRVYDFDHTTGQYLLEDKEGLQFESDPEFMHLTPDDNAVPDLVISKREE